MFLLLGGTGVGYSVQKNHIEQLPDIRKSVHNRRFLVSDDIQGWADSIKALMKWAFGLGSKPVFDYSDIRPKGARLVTAGGKAPGPEPLKICHAHIFAILDRKTDGSSLTSLECHDILCHIANAVLAGGIRRSAMIALFNLDDAEMLTSKYGNWWETDEQRGRCNNSAVIKRNKITKDSFINLWSKIETSGSGEPGFYLTNNVDWGSNPCVEIGMLPMTKDGLSGFQFCNLTEINGGKCITKEIFMKACEASAILGTIQAGYTNFKYLSDATREITEREALIGCSITSLACGSKGTSPMNSSSGVSSA